MKNYKSYNYGIRENAFKKHGVKIISVFVTLFIISLLVMSGPAKAFELGLTADKDNVTQGGEVTFTATFDIQSQDKYLPIKNLELDINGLTSKTCNFNVDGSIISGCEGITSITASGTYQEGYGYGYGYDNSIGYGYNFGYGYGYGYGYGTGATTLTYKIVLDTTNYKIGNYKTQLKALIGDKTFTSTEFSITINPSGASDTETNENVVSGVNTSFLGGDLGINLNGSGKIVVSEFSSQPTGTSTFSLPALGKWFQIETNITSDISGTIIRVYYTDAEVSAAGIDESTLKLYYYNTTSSTWIAYDSPNGGVDTTNNYVWAITNHFSIWGAFGSAPTPAATTTTSGTGGGACTTTWTCTAFSDCSAAGTQTRTCSYPTNFCAPTAAKPAESQTCMPAAAVTPTPATETVGGTPGITGAATGTPGITGGVIGNLKQNAKAIGIIVGVLVALGLVLFGLKRRRLSIKSADITVGSEAKGKKKK